MCSSKTKLSLRSCNPLTLICISSYHLHSSCHTLPINALLCLQVVVEQTETPEALTRRNEENRKRGDKLAQVVRREKVAVLSKVCSAQQGGSAALVACI